MDIRGHTFLVSGGSSGLGAATVARLSRKGAHTVLADIRPPADVTALNEAQAIYHPTDVTDEAAVLGAIDAARSRFGALHGAVVCAGVIYAQKVAGSQGPFDLAAFRRVIEVNLIGTFNVLRLAAQAMLDNEPMADGERGVIITTSSVSAFEGQMGQAAYSASKGGVAALTLPAARDLAKHGIRVVSLAPGVFDTPLMQQVSSNVRASLESQIPFPRRFGDPEEYAALVEHVIENRMFNGAVVRLDAALRMQ